MRAPSRYFTVVRRATRLAPCAMCGGPIHPGDRVYVTACRKQLLVMALAHAPDCVDSMLRELRAERAAA